MELLELLRSLGIEIAAEDVASLTDEDLAGYLEDLQAAYQEARDARELDRAEQIIVGIEGIRSENAARVTAAEELEARFAELDERVTVAETVPDEDEPAEEAPAEAPAEDEPAEQTPAEAPAEESRVPVAASVPARTIPRREAEHRRVQDRAARRMPQAPAERQQAPAEVQRPTIVAGADLRGFSPGDEIPDIRTFGEATANRIDALRKASAGNPHGVGRFLIASLQVEYPDDRVLGDNAAANAEIIESAMVAAAQPNAEAIVAAGGLCAPTAVSYDLFGVGNDRRPIRDALLRFNANRGGVRFIRPPLLTGLATAVDIITEEEDTAGPTKPCLTITCGTEVEEVIHAVTKCLQVGNFSRRTFPEQFARFWELAGVQHAREAETELWDQMVTDSTAVTTGEQLGAARDILENLDQAAAAYRSRHRMSPDDTLRVIAPDWVPNLIRADLTRQMAGDNTYAVTNAQIAQWLAVRGIAITWSPDITGNIFGSQGAQALIRWPDTVDFLMFAEGSFAFLDGGVLDFGMEIRDSTLNTSNNVRAFTETFEGTAFFGVESLRIRMNVCPDGSASALVDISPCTIGS